MVKTIKWELLKWYYRLRWFVLFYLAAFGVCETLSILGTFNNSNSITEYMLKGISLLFSAYMLLFSIIVPTVNMLIDYILPHKYMESAIQRKPGTVIYAKLLVNAVIFCVGMVIGLLSNLVFMGSTVKGEKYFWVTGDILGQSCLYFIFGVLMPLIVLYFYMLTYCIKAEIKHRILLMLIFIVITIVVLYLLSKVALISKIYGVSVFIAIMTITTSSEKLIENNYEPR